VTDVDHEPFVREYLRAIENGAIGEALARYYTSDVIQEEFPNRLVPNGATRDLSAILQGAERGQQVLRKQEYVIHDMISSGSRVAVEVTWIGTLAIALGSVAPGGELKARFCMVLELESGRIRRQRNYDCFEPF
jgi:ketosteroid isomerase-like protein